MNIWKVFETIVCVVVSYPLIRTYFTGDPSFEPFVRCILILLLFMVTDIYSTVKALADAKNIKAE